MSKHPGGRPTDYNPEYCDFARELLKSGASKFEIAYEIGVNRATINDWAEKHEEFSNAINEGLEDSESWWVKSGRVNLTNKAFNSRLYEINMMNRFGWMKKSHGKNDVSVKQEDAIKDLE